ncbi:MAG: DUF1385 domain-containing protein [bacterium]|nr:DUF1385 domain-containing protein [bacterium]
MLFKSLRLFKTILPSMLMAVTRPLVGGQAVIEGVMMRSPNSFAVAVRRPDKSIIVRERAWLSFSQKLSFLRWPLLRGATMLVESLYNGMSALQFSAEQAMAVDENKSSVSTENLSAKSDKKLDYTLLGTMIVSMILGIALFKAVPHMTAFALGELFGHDGQSALPITSSAFHLVDGTIKMSLFIGYILLISRMPDVKRIFMYHGAEHKSVYVHEKELDLEVDAARLQSTAHPRCGTSLILMVIVVSILVFALIIPLLPVVSSNTLIQSLFTLAIKIPLMLPVAGIAYEFQRAAAKYPKNIFIKAFIAPGMLMQSLTTREPTDDQLEVALTALRKALWRESIVQEELRCSVKPSSQIEELEVYENFAEVRKAIA